MRAFWKRFTLRNLRFQDRHHRINELYRLSDPWNLDSERERFRYLETNRLIASVIARPVSLLEVGCGEGYQSEYLAKICERLTGIDVSARAIARARARLPHASFEVATLEQSRLARQNGPFDLIVAAEVLYYMANIPECLMRMEALGRICFVTYYDACGGDLDAILTARGASPASEIVFEETRWKARYWISGRV